MIPQMFCEHANECPTSACRCPADCACREKMCAQTSTPQRRVTDETCTRRFTPRELHWLHEAVGDLLQKYRYGNVTSAEELYALEALRRKL